MLFTRRPARDPAGSDGVSAAHLPCILAVAGWETTTGAGCWWMGGDWRRVMKVGGGVQAGERRLRSRELERRCDGGDCGAG